MGYSESTNAMESRKGSVSSGLGSSSDVRGRSLKSSPFCPISSSKLTQSLIKHHMVSHYKRVLSAKAATDTSVPKSLLCSVKYNDRIKQDQLKRRSRPQSAHSLSQRSRRASCSPTQSRSSVCDDDGPYVCSRSSVVSSPRFTTNFHYNQSVYSSSNINANHTRPASEIKYRNAETALQRRQSGCSLRASEDQNMHKPFQDPVQKTYSGDLLQKHSRLFTPDKPFTPKMLKSETSSYLSKYRYYRAPPTKTPLDFNKTQQVAHRVSAKSKQDTQVLDESSQDLTTEPECSEAELSGTFLSSSSQQNWKTKSWDHYFFNDLQRASSSDDRKTSKMETRSVSAEEEIEYLEFISAVTEDILSRGHISDRVINRVFQWHLDKNLHKLDEGKMRHLLEVLQKDFDQPTNILSSGELDKEEDNELDSLLLHLQSGQGQSKAKADNDLFFNVSQGKYHNPSGYGEPLQVSTPLGSTDRIASPKVFEREHEEDIISGGSALSLLNEPVTNTTGTNDEKHEDINATLLKEDQAGTHSDAQSKELEDLALTLSQSLHVSSDTLGEHVNTDAVLENTAVSSISDDEF